MLDEICKHRAILVALPADKNESREWQRGLRVGL